MASMSVGVKMARGRFVGSPPLVSQPLRVEPRPVDLKEMEQPSRKLDPSLLGQKSGKVRVQIWLTDTSSEVMANLKAVGVEVVTAPQPGKVVIATVDVTKLLDVAK